MLDRLDQAVRSVCPIDGLCRLKNGSVRIDYRPEASSQQKSEAQAIVESFDWSEAAHAAWENQKRPAHRSLRDEAEQALSDHAVYLANPSPSPSQMASQLRRLTIQMSLLIRRTLED